MHYTRISVLVVRILPVKVYTSLENCTQEQKAHSDEDYVLLKLELKLLCLCIAMFDHAFWFIR